MDFISQNKKIVIVPDKFKGSLTAPDVAEAIAEGVKDNYLACGKQIPQMLLRPMADGGDGSMEVMEAALSAAGITSRKLSAEVTSLLGDSTNAPYLLIGDSGQTAFIEMSKVCGLSQIPPEKRDPMNFTTYGLGELMRQVLELHPITKLIIAIGGSATNDGGHGLIEALAHKRKECLNIEIEVACDVTNPLLGKNGATYVYGPQKFNPDISAEKLADSLNILEERIAAWSKSLGLKDFRKESEYPGAGAAGGVGFALHAVLGAKLIPGWKLFSELLHLEEDIAAADLVITGEGRFDDQSLNGKLPSGISVICRKYHKPLWLVCGQSTISESQLTSTGITRVFSLTDLNSDHSYCIQNAKELIIKILQNK